MGRPSSWGNSRNKAQRMEVYSQCRSVESSLACAEGKVKRTISTLVGKRIESALEQMPKQEPYMLYLEGRPFSSLKKILL